MKTNKPTKKEMEEMFSSQISIVAETDQLTYSTINNLSLATGIPFEILAGRALFLGVEHLIKEIQDNITQK